jgi:hypothetical protein
LTARAKHGRLNARQQDILDAKRFAGRMPAGALIDLLGPLAQLDADAGRSRATAQRWIVGGVIGTIFSGFVVLASGAGWVLAPLPLAGLALAFGAGLRYQRLKQMDLSNKLGALVMPLLAVLREETEPARDVEIDLDLRAPTAREKMVDQQPARQEGADRIVDSRFRDAWLSGSAQLHDGARVAWSIVDEIAERHRTRRNPRGKIKTKARHKKRSIMKVSISLPEESFALAADAARVDAAVGAGAGAGDATKVRVKPGDGQQTIKLARVLKSTSLEPADARGLIDLLAAAYRRVHPRQEAPRP